MQHLMALTLGILLIGLSPGCPRVPLIQQEVLSLSQPPREGEEHQPIQITRYHGKETSVNRLILLSGWYCGPAWFDLMARHIAAHGEFEVWLPWRRSLSAHVLKTGVLTGSWDLLLELEDIRQVVDAANAAGGIVVLGGWSAGAIESLAFAAHRFKDGTIGYKLLDGLVSIDAFLIPPSAEETAWQPPPDMADQVRHLLQAVQATIKDEDADSELASPELLKRLDTESMSNRTYLQWLISGSLPGSIGTLLQIETADDARVDLDQFLTWFKSQPGIMDPAFPEELAHDITDLVLNAFHRPEWAIESLADVDLPLFLAMGKRTLMQLQSYEVATWISQHLATRDIAQRDLFSVGHGELMIAPDMKLDLFERVRLWMGRLSGKKRTNERVSERFDAQ